MSTIRQLTSRARALLRCSHRRLLQGALLVACVAALAYGPSLDHGFIYDDYWTVVSNRHLDKELPELLRAAASGRSVEWKMPDATRPLMGVSLWWDRQFSGLSPAFPGMWQVNVRVPRTTGPGAQNVILFLNSVPDNLSSATGYKVVFYVAPL